MTPTHMMTGWKVSQQDSLIKVNEKQISLLFPFPVLELTCLSPS